MQETVDAMTKSLGAVTLPLNADARTIADMVKAEGIVVLPGFFPTEIIAGLDAEFDRFFDDARARGDTSLIERAEGITVPAVRNKLDATRYPFTTEVFARQIMRDVSVQYLDTSDIGLNHQIYVNLNRGTDAPVTQLPVPAAFRQDLDAGVSSSTSPTRPGRAARWAPISAATMPTASPATTPSPATERPWRSRTSCPTRK